ncbi:uncharacterized protein PADG_00374 [Paracoccidioides brasiliensis Pb18]|uniref:Uncharacterized protein n=1 Tax=Paracoccidioides brasiliensis (strain Pb18) TaxID=502780 RepID=C1G0I4_PARBD|nr:uncharacterized protein PADG_00374 [Paracoccidioides brasiliensis Pb18]EEH44085.2 hypothetical protein PADG_00374 [Paracoccidioides brasiliensis Pb18]
MEYADERVLTALRALKCPGGIALSLFGYQQPTLRWQFDKNSHDPTTGHGVSTCSVLTEELMAIQISCLCNTASQTVAHRQRVLNLCHAPPVI